MAKFIPKNGHQNTSSLSSVVTLTPPAGVTKVLIQAVAKNLRFTVDGTTPTASVGFQLRAGDPPICVELTSEPVKVIQESNGSSLQYCFGN